MLYAFLLYGIFLSLKDIVRAPKTYVLGALYGGVGGIRTLGRLLTVTRFPVVLVMTASIPLHGIRCLCHSETAQLSYTK